MIQSFDYLMPTRILFGEGRTTGVGKVVAKLGRKAILVTGKRAMKQLGITDQVMDSLKKEKVESVVFDQVEPNPTIETVNQGGELARKENCDVVIGLGGGSALDAAKAIAVMISHNGNAKHFLGRDNVPGPIVPLVAIPSTSGTGSEVTRYAVLTDKSTKRKQVIRSHFIIPRIAVIDPQIMKSQSSYLTSCTGMDALTHAIEAYVHPMANFLSDLITVKAISLAARYLRRAVWNGDDTEAREGMTLASTLAGMAICQAGTGAAHGLGMSIGGFFNTDHGTTVGILLPYVMEYNLPTSLNKYAYIAFLMGQNTTSLTTREAALEAARAVRDLIQDIDIPLTLGQLKVKIELATEVAKDAKEQGSTKNNPRKLTLQDIKELYQRACG
jgi:alcohol dehydrogenase class IV